jgi:hypothetical protein
MRYIKLFEDYDDDIKNSGYGGHIFHYAYLNNEVIKPDVSYEVFSIIEDKLRKIYDILGLPLTVGIRTKQIGNKLNYITNQYYQFKFDTNINSKPYSIVSTLSRPDLIPFVGASLEKPFDYKDKVYICVEDVNRNKTFIQELSASLSKYDLDTNKLILKESLNFKGFHHYFNTDDPDKIYQNVNNFLLMLFTDLKNGLSKNVYTTPMGCVEITSLSFVIKEFIVANKNLNSPVIIPDTVTKPLLKAIGRLPKSHEVLNEISKNNPILYNALKSDNTDKAVDMHDMGFSD